MSGPDATPTFDAAYAAEQVRRSRNPFRRLVKWYYLGNVLRHVRGPAIDLGCGAGQLLARLPAGSAGIEINPVLVAALKAKGLDARHYDVVADDFRFSPFQPGRFKNLVMSHALEHFEDAATVLKRLFQGCERLGIERVIIVVPGHKGYASDPTHRTFISPAYLRQHGLDRWDGFAMTHSYFFPFDLEKAGEWFIYNEYTAIFQRL